MATAVFGFPWSGWSLDRIFSPALFSHVSFQSRTILDSFHGRDLFCCCEHNILIGSRHGCIEHLYGRCESSSCAPHTHLLWPYVWHSQIVTQLAHYQLLQCVYSEAFGQLCPGQCSDYFAQLSLNAQVVSSSYCILCLRVACLLTGHWRRCWIFGGTCCSAKLDHCAARAGTPHQICNYYWTTLVGILHPVSHMGCLGGSTSGFACHRFALFRSEHYSARC